MEKAGLGALLASLLMCLPCLLVAVAAAGGLAVASSIAGWVSDNATIVVLGVATAVVVGVGVVASRRRWAAACEVPPRTSQQEEAVQRR